MPVKLINSIICKKCGAALPENAKFCHLCGRAVEYKPTSRKRGNGQGTVIKRGRTYTAIVNAATYHDGDKVVRKRVSKGGFPTKKDAIAYIPTLQKRADGSLYTDLDMTFEELYKMWEEQHENDVVKSTMNCYKAAWKYYKDIRYYKVTNIKTSMLQSCLDNCGKGKRTQENMKSLGTMLFRMAMSNDIVSRNYAEGLIPRGEKQEPRTPFTEVELAKMREIVADPKYDFSKSCIDIILVLCYTGFRIEELLSLTLDSFHEEKDWSYFVGGSKTEAGRDRIVGISPKIMPYVKRRLADCDGRYISGENGNKISAKKFRQLYYNSLDDAGIERRVPHCTRHTFATMLKNVDVSDRDKMEMIGHSSISMTIEYTHSDLDGLKKLTSQL